MVVVIYGLFNNFIMCHKWMSKMMLSYLLQGTLFQTYILYTTNEKMIVNEK